MAMWPGSPSTALTGSLHFLSVLFRKKAFPFWMSISAEGMWGGEALSGERVKKLTSPTQIELLWGHLHSDPCTLACVFKLTAV